MGHRLEPRDGIFLQSSEVVTRLREEFDYVDISAEDGADHVGQILLKLVELGASEELVEFYSVRRSKTIMILVADYVGAKYDLYFALIPDEAPFSSYSSAQNEKACQPLIERCARVLNNEIALV